MDMFSEDWRREFDLNLMHRYYRMFLICMNVWSIYYNVFIKRRNPLTTIIISDMMSDKDQETFKEDLRKALEEIKYADEVEVVETQGC